MALKELVASSTNLLGNTAVAGSRTRAASSNVQVSPLGLRPVNRQELHSGSSERREVAVILRSSTVSKAKRPHRGKLLKVVGNTTGKKDKDEENFGDVDKNIADYFTFKAAEVVLQQLHELDPPTYMWFYQFSAKNNPNGKGFIQQLVRERQALGERVMVTRLHLFKKWAKRYNHANMHNAIQNQNLELLRERVTQTVTFMPEEEGMDLPNVKR